jgi:subtilisin family serine protease
MATKDGVAAFIIGILALLLGGCSPGAAPNAPGAPADPNAADRRFIVRVKDVWEQSAQGRLVSPVDSIAQAVGGESQIDLIYNNVYSVQLPAGADVGAALDKLGESAQIEHVEPDAVVHHMGAPNDPLFTQQWAHAVVKSAEAWDLGQGSDSVTVAVIDTGMDRSHPDLAANVWTNPGEIPGNGRDDDGNGLVDDVNGYDFANNDADPTADDSPHFHGTHVAGSIGAVGGNGVGVVGQSPRVKIMPLKFLAADGGGYTSNAIRAIYYAIGKGAKVISNSWGGPGASQELANAIDKARQAGILFVVAAGNGGQDGVGDNNDVVPTYPASYGYDNVIAVAATDPSDQLTRFSNYGPRTVHVGAPGQNILSTKNGASYQTMSGTSMATPLVSGLAALLIARRPDLNYKQIKQAILSTVDVVPGLNGRVASNGRVNAFKAMQSIASGPQPSPTPTPTPTSTVTPSPTPTPSPTVGIAPQPLIAGYTAVRVRSPYVQLPIDYDVSAFASGGASQAYIEISKPNRSC